MQAGGSEHVKLLRFSFHWDDRDDATGSIACTAFRVRASAPLAGAAQRLHTIQFADLLHGGVA